MRLVGRSSVAVLAAMVLAGGVAACGDDGSDATGSTDATTTAAAGGESAGGASLEKFYSGIIGEPPKTGPAAQKGKTIWFSNCEAFEGCQRFRDGVQAAADALGWKLKIVDDKADPNTGIKVINQAIAAKADGVVQTLFDCPGIKSALQAAKTADIPVVSLNGLDCDNAEFGGKEGDGLFAATFKGNGFDDQLEYFRELGKIDADYIIAAAKERGVEKPSILQVQNKDQLFTKVRHQAFADQIESACPQCELKQLDFTIPQLSTGKGQQVFKSGMLANPNANILYYAADAFLASGLQAAMEANKGKYEIICCGDGGADGLRNVRRDDLAPLYAVNASPFEMWGWGSMDQMNRAFAGESRDEMPGEARVRN